MDATIAATMSARMLPFRPQPRRPDLSTVFIRYRCLGWKPAKTIAAVL
jgi:hypothetical protein